MFIARIMALLTKEKNTTEIYCSPSSMRNLFLYGPNQRSLYTPFTPCMNTALYLSVKPKGQIITQRVRLQDK